MPRRPRIDPPGGVHHVMNRGIDRRSTFTVDADRMEFGRLLGEVHERFGVSCIAYCLMDNHYHLVLRCPDGGLSSAMQLLGSVYTAHYNERHGRDGPLFRGRFRSIPITTDAYLTCAVRYVHRNCLDLPGVDDVSSYRWSSHRAYLGHRRTPAWLDTATVLDGFNSPTAFEAFVAGDDAFRQSDRIGEDDVRSAVRLAIAERWPAHGEGESQQGIERTVLRLLQMRRVEPVVAGRPTTSTAAERSARSRARRRIREQPALGAVVDLAADLLDIA